MTVAECIRDLRETIGESQQAFATNIGISIRALANYEAGSREPEIKTIAKLLRVANHAGRIDLCDLLFDQIHEALGFDLITFPETQGLRPRGYLFTKLHNEQEVMDAIALLAKRRGPVKDGTEEIRKQMNDLMIRGGSDFTRGK